MILIAYVCYLIIYYETVVRGAVTTGFGCTGAIGVVVMVGRGAGACAVGIVGIVMDPMFGIARDVGCVAGGSNGIFSGAGGADGGIGDGDPAGMR